MHFYKKLKTKKPPSGGFSVTFRFFSYADKPRISGTKVKEEAKNQCFHGVNLPFHLAFKISICTINLLLDKVKEEKNLPSFN